MVPEYISFPEFVQIWADAQGFGDIPDIHYEMALWFESTLNEPNRLLMAYRHSGKSWLLTLYVCWRLYLDREWTCIIVSATEKLAKRNSKFVRTVLSTHPKTMHLVPDNSDKEAEWQTFQFSVKGRQNSLHASVQITSVGSKMTGMHGDEILGDDVEVAENVRTEEGREALALALEEMTSLADRMLFVGTPHHEDSIYKNMEFNQDFAILRKPVRDPITNLPAWPERHDEAWVSLKEKSNSTGRFLSQYMLVYKKAYDAFFDTELINTFDDKLEYDELDSVHLNFKADRPKFWLNDEEVIDIRAYWDSASGLKYRDRSVIAVCAKTRHGNVYLLDLEVLPEVDLKNGKGFDAQCRQVLRVCSRCHVNQVHVETNFVITLAAELKRTAREQGNKVRIVEAVRGSGTKKEEFIADTLEPLIKTNRFYVHERIMRDTPFKLELDEFPNSKHDDCIDATCGAIHALTPTRVAAGDKPLTDRTVRSVRPVVINDPR